jgi:exonuclease VII small subunit
MADPNPPQDPFEMFRRLWGPLGVPVPGMAMPTLDPQEIDKRVQELKSVEMWLSMNLNMLRTAIQGLEMQKAGLAGIQQAMQQAMNMAMPQDSKDKKP